MRFCSIFYTVVFFGLFIFTGTRAGTDDLAGLENDLREIQVEIEKAENDAEKYPTGLINSMVLLRLETLRATASLLEQKAVALREGATFEFKVFARNPDPVLAERLAKEILIAQGKLVTAELEASKHSNGLIGVMAEMAVATQRQTIAMLTQEALAAKYGLSYQKEALKSIPSPGASSKDLELPAPTTTPPREKKETGEAPLTGKWIVRKERSPIDDSRRVILMRDAKGPASGGLMRKHPTLVLRCNENETKLYISFGFRIGSYLDEGPAPITYRIGDFPAVDARWSPSTDRKALGLWSGQTSIPFIRKLVDAERFVARAADSDGLRTTAVFDISGLKEAIKPLAEACHWQLTPQPTEKKEKASNLKSSSPDPYRDFASVENFVNEIKSGNAPDQERIPAPTPLTLEEIADVRKQVSRCWAIPPKKGVSNIGPIEISLEMLKDGTVKSARVVDIQRLETDPIFRVVAQSARRAVLNPRCNPLTLPPDKFEYWKRMTLNFTP